MNLHTHILLATKLLDACGLPRGGAIYAVLPELDLKPAHFHRMFANILLYQPTIIDTALEIFALPPPSRCSTTPLSPRFKRSVCSSS